MIGHVLEQCAILAAAIVLLGVPGVALASLLRLRAALPDALVVVAAALLGSLVACVATAVQLTLHDPVRTALTAHGVLSVVLVVAALLVRRRRGSYEVVERGITRWTAIIVAVGALFAWIVRGTISLDALYHVAVSRKLVELDAATFDNVNRFADGGPNPAYALPGWHAFVGWTSTITGSDPIIAWEIMPVLVVALGALAAGGLARVILDRPVALPVGAFSWVLMRELFARREVDGDAILFGAVPGQVTFELALPLVIAAIAIGLRAEERRVLRTSLVTAFVGIAAIVVYHANYLPYVAIIGLGYAAWWLVDRANRDHDGRRLLVVGGAVAVMSAACMAVVLPVLASLENFGNAPEGDRIDYHLTETLGMTHVRGGHAFEMLGLPGMVAVLAAPVLALRVRRGAYGIVSGGLLALLTFSFVPPLFQLLRATGSLTVLLRINHAIGVLLVVVLAALVLELADWVQARGWSHRRRQAWGVVVIVALACVGVVLGYDRFMTDWPGYVGWVGLLVVFAVLAVRRLGSDDEVRDVLVIREGACRGLVASVAAVLTVGLLMPVGAISMRRALENMDDFRADSGGLAQGDLRCLGGPVLKALQEVPEGSVVLSDPVASFRAMAIAPVYVVGDYKVWNAATSDNRAEERLASINRFFDSSLTPGERVSMLDDQRVDYVLLDVQDGRWLDVDLGRQSVAIMDRAWEALDRFSDVQAYDGGGVTRLIRQNKWTFKRVAVDPRARESAIPEANPDVDAPCNSYGLWKVTSLKSEAGTVAAQVETAELGEPIDVAPGTVRRTRLSVVAD